MAADIMKTRGLRRWIFGVVGAFWLAAPFTGLTAGEIELRGIEGRGDELRLSLRNTRTGAGGWVKVGGRFDGFAVRSYDEKTGVARLARDGVEISVSLASAAIVAQRILTPEEREMVRKTVSHNLRQLASAADQYYLEYGATETKLELLVGENKYIRELKPVDGEDYSKLVFKQGQALKIKTAGGVVVEWRN